MAKPLQQGLSDLVNDLFDVFSNTSNEPFDAALNISNAIYKYSKTGKLDIEVTITQGAVTAFMTAGPLIGNGEGKMLSNDGKSGLLGTGADSALVKEFARKLELAMTIDSDFVKSNSYDYGSGGDYNSNGISAPASFDDELMIDSDYEFWTEETQDLAVGGPMKKATYVAIAIHDFWKNSTFKTQDFTVSPLPAPGPVGPVVVVGMTGIGGLGKPVPGTGFAIAKNILYVELFNIFRDLSETPISDRCDKIAEAIHNYFKQANIITSVSTGTLTAAVDIITGTGTYNTGKVKSTGNFI